MKHGTTEIAFVEDPDGYKIELIQLRRPPGLIAPARDNSGLPRFPLQRSRKKPNRYCATRRIWISSAPSVMR